VVSHGHRDHVNGVPVLCRRLGIPVFTSSATAWETGLAAAVGEGLSSPFETGSPFDVGGLRITPFAVPHDSADPAGFVISDGEIKAGFATDLGSLTMEVLNSLAGCDALVLESNHDAVMLKEGPYPAKLKKRVKGPRGHLSNDDAAELLQAVAHRGLRQLVLAHLSTTNNKPELPLETAGKALAGRSPSVEISLGWQDRPGLVIKIG
jgi:phosphoribosyl 1,2-cyclic phosphodiesterase